MTVCDVVRLGSAHGHRDGWLGTYWSGRWHCAVELPADAADVEAGPSVGDGYLP